MAEYIEREAARQAHIKASLTTRLIDAIPAADVAEVRHGRWIEYPRAHYFKCSGCKYTIPYRKRLIDITDFFDSLTNCETVSEVLTKLSKQPTIDPVEAAGGCYCRECKHYHAGTGWCDQLSYFQTSDGEPCSPAESTDWKMFQENDYCSIGQRKEAAHDKHPSDPV